MIWLKIIVLWILKIASGLAMLLGVFLVGWNSVAFYYLATDRVQPDFDQPPMESVAILLAVGMVLLIGGYLSAKWLRTDRAL